MNPQLVASTLVLVAAVLARAALTERTRHLTRRRLSASSVSRSLVLPTGIRRSGPAPPAAVSAFATAIATALRSGVSLQQALAEARASIATTPHRAFAGEIANLVTRAEAVGVSAAANEWAAATPHRGIRLVCAALSLGSTTGGAVARALDGVAETIEARAAVAREVQAQAATARASAAVLVAAPLVFAGFASAGDTSARAFLLGEPIGLACVIVALALQCVGGLWMARITQCRS